MIIVFLDDLVNLVLFLWINKYFYISLFSSFMINFVIIS